MTRTALAAAAMLALALPASAASTSCIRPAGNPTGAGAAGTPVAPGDNRVTPGPTQGPDWLQLCDGATNIGPFEVVDADGKVVATISGRAVQALRDQGAR
ncbi:hypothetical protein MKK70_21160 [Methylobacterium sp. E-041]|uniref:hypothetical protein n=1 Tax=Methylobacterium sp. E-041 TaxID=2836573 RepID=UPI001FB94106|nr:hypothetical protein [Methylobacterium sp. E-041]MCJ2107839.1 hypothetical protein [Methylobacterium sp. E-041]